MGTRKLAALVVFLFGALGGCADLDAYVYRSGEFDRGASGFGRDPTDVSNEACRHLSATGAWTTPAETGIERLS